VGGVGAAGCVAGKAGSARTGKLNACGAGAAVTGEGLHLGAANCVKAPKNNAMSATILLYLRNRLGVLIGASGQYESRVNVSAVLQG
jgi:hypothetical protein